MRATDTSKIASLAGGAAGAGVVGIGIAFSKNVITDGVAATVDGGNLAVDAGGIMLLAQSCSRVPGSRFARSARAGTTLGSGARGFFVAW